MRKPILVFAAALVGIAAVVLDVPAQTEGSQTAMTPSNALTALKQGNERFASGAREHRDYSAELRATAAKQYPFAAIVSCMDSRAPVEIVFDRGIGEVFSLRGAGNVIDQDVLGGLEYAVAVIGVKLIMVLGHSNCGAVRGAIDGVELGHLTQLLARIRPAIPNPVPERKSADEAFVARVAESNVRLAMKEIHKRSAILDERLTAGKVGLAGGMYDLATGKVVFYAE